MTAITETIADQPVPSAAETATTIYVMGRGQSGSTFLDVLIGNTPEVEGVGELVSGLNRGEDEICSCGETLGNCSYWSAVRKAYATRTEGRDLIADGAWLWRASDIRNFGKAARANLDEAGTKWAEYRQRNHDLMAAIAEVSGKAMILDSNKEFTRGLMLLKSDPNARVLHLHRAPKAIVGSRYYRLKEKNLPFKFLKKERQLTGPWLFPAMMLVAAAWSAGMVFGARVKARFPDRVLHVAYENLVSNPDAELKRIGDFLGVDTTDVRAGIREERSFSAGHNVGGNDLRHEGGFKFVPNVKGRRKLPLVYRLGVHLFAAPGYLVRALFVRSQ